MSRRRRGPTLPAPGSQGDGTTVEQARWEAMLQTLFKIQRHEARRALLLFTYLLAAVGAFIIGRNVRDTLFLSHFNRDVLVYMYITQAGVVALPAWFYAKFTDGLRRDRLLVASLAVMIAVSLGLYALVGTGQGWVYIALYNWIELSGAILVIQFWTFAADVFSSREAKRLFPFVGGGGVLANIVVGALIVAAVRALGVAGLLVVMAALLGVCLACAVALGRTERARLHEQMLERRNAAAAAGRVRVRTTAQGVLQSTHLKIIAVMTCITFVTVQFVDFQFKTTSRETFTGEELAAFYGYFTIGSGLLAAAVQFGLSARLLERYGVVVALLVLPASLVAGNLGVLATGGSLVAATFTQGAQASLRYSIYDATMQVLYTPVPANVRARAKMFIDGVVKPGAICAAGLLMWLVGNRLGLAVSSLAWVELGLLAGWLGLVLSIKREYVRELLATLRRRRLNFDQAALTIADAPTIELLRRTLRSPLEHEVRHALELLVRVPGVRLADDLTPLLEHPAADIRARAVALLGSSASGAAAELVAARFKDPAEEVRAAAVRAFCLLGRERAITTVQLAMADPAVPVRAAAVAGLIVHGGLDGILHAAEHLKSMLEHRDAAVRDQAARVLGEIRVRNFYAPVLALMRDPNVRVQLSAIAAAGELQSPELVPALVYRLARRETAHAAARALARHGESVLDVLAKVLGEPMEDLAIRRQVPKVLAAVGSRAALDILLGHLEVQDPGLRREVARAAVRVKLRLGGVAVARERIEAIVAAEVRGAFELIATIDDLGERPDRPSLLHDALAQRVAWTQDRIFKMLSIVYSARTVELVAGNLSSGSANVRANAAEVLDNLLAKPVKRLLLPLVEDAPLPVRRQRGAELFRLDRHSVEQRLGELMGGADPWLRVCALHEAGERRLLGLAATVAGCLDDADPVVRETAARALTQLLPPDQWRRSLEPLLSERVEWVRRYAQGLAGSAPVPA